MIGPTHRRLTAHPHAFSRRSAASGYLLTAVFRLSGEFSGYQLKIIQKAITLTVFALFAWFVLKEKLTWNYAVSFGLIMLAVWFATAFKPATPPAH